MKLSIVIPVRNEAETIVTLVERVRAVDYGMSREIIVVDGASTDGTREALLGLPACPEIVLVLEDQARGKGRAVRTGFERATGDILVVQDADLELDPAQIPSLLRATRERGATGRLRIALQRPGARRHSPPELRRQQAPDMVSEFALLHPPDRYLDVLQGAAVGRGRELSTCSATDSTSMPRFRADCCGRVIRSSKSQSRTTRDPSMKERS